MRWFRRPDPTESLVPHLQAVRSAVARVDYQLCLDRAQNPFVRYGHKCFSQGDEDGLTLEILRRLKCNHGAFIEFGIGNGLENNTLVLLACGWEGTWVGNENLAFALPADSPLTYRKQWITLDNILDHLPATLDLISLDVDGNDLHFAKRLLDAGITPSLIIIEYNAKFPPPVRWSMPYDSHHIWRGDDYFGASLCAFDDLMASHGYFLVCCNAMSGCNAFFVQQRHRALFPEVPAAIEQIYVPPRYDLLHSRGHPVALRTIEQVIFRPATPRPRS